MRRSFLIFWIFCVLALLALFLPSRVAAAEQTVLVKFKESISREEIAAKFKTSVDKVTEIPDIDVYKVRTQLAVGGAMEILGGEIDFVEPDYIYAIQRTPNDPYRTSQYALSSLNLYNAWNTTTGSTSIKIAIVDTGVDGAHPDLTSKVLAGYDFVNGESTLANTDSDDNGHGTVVVSVAAAVTNNGKGIAGTSWGARILPVKVMDENGNGYASDVANGIIWAANQGAKVINLSLGSSSPSSTLESAVNYAAVNKGVLVVAATGNSYASSIMYPARYANVVAVGALNSSNQRAAFSNYGEGLDLMAPGVNICAAVDVGNTYSCTADGTSMAAPYVAGVAALVRSRYSNASISQVRNILTSTATNLGSSYYYGYGKPNAYSAVTSALTNLNDYHSTIVSQNAFPPTLVAGESYSFVIKYRNTGLTTWQKNKVNLGTDREQDRTSSLIREGSGPSGWIAGNRVTMQESRAGPGDTATYAFWMKVPQGFGTGCHREYFRLVADGVTWMENYGVYWNVCVGNVIDKYHYRWITQNGYPTLRPGQAYNFTLTVKNTGTATWRKNRVNLGTDRPQDRTPGFLREPDNLSKASGWISGNRITMQQAQVAPGQNATFSFWLKVPQNRSPGTYREYFRVVADGIDWLEDYGIFWDIAVR